MPRRSPDFEPELHKKRRLNFRELADWYFTDLSFPKIMVEILGPLVIASFVKEPAGICVAAVLFTKGVFNPVIGAVYLEKKEEQITKSK